MKKVLYLLGVALFALTSCSNDDKESASGNPGLPKTVKYTGRDYTGTSTFSYDGNKIKNFTDDDGSKRVFTYTGNIITKVEDGGVLKLNTVTLTYDNNKLKSYSAPYVDFFSTGYTGIDYTYNSDGTILALKKKSDYLKVEDVCTFDTKGNIIRVAHSSGSSERIIEYEYDTGNNPYKDILGYALLQTAYYAYWVFNQDVYSINNLTTITEKYKDGRIIKKTTFENTYDANNFLTKTVINGDEGKKTYEYTYY